MKKNIGSSETEIRLLVNEEVNNIRKSLKDKDKILEEYKSEHGILASMFRDLKECIASAEPTAMIYNPKKQNSKSTDPCTVVVQINDTHMGEVQNSNEIEGFGEYNPEICRKRCINFITKVIDWTYVQRNAYKIDECVVLVLGDLIAGDIHQELMVTNAFPSPVQAVESGKLLSDQIALLAPHFNKIRIEFITEDNHSRMTKKPQCKEAGLNSLNYVVGFIAKERLSKYNNVQFNIYPQLEKVVNVQGRKYLITHGHGIKSWMGVPWYSVDRKVGKEAIRRMNGVDTNKFDKIVLAHFHTPVTSQYYWAGGSVSGTSAYDNSCGRYSEPSQASWLVNDHGEFNRVDWNLK